MSTKAQVKLEKISN